MVADVRRHVGGPVREALAERLVRKLGKHGITLAEGRSRRLAAELAEAVVRAVAKHLPAAAAALSAAAKDPAAGVTLTFAFAFADRAALRHGRAGAPECCRSTPGRTVTEAAVARQTAAEIAHWLLAAQGLADLDDAAAPEAWAGLESYLQRGLRDRMAAMVAAAGGRRLAAVQRLAANGADPAAGRAGVLRLRQRYLQAETSWTSTATRSTRGPTRRCAACCAGWTRWPATRWRPPSARSASTPRRRWSTSTRASAPRSCGPGSGCGTRPTPRPRPRSS